MSRRKGELSPAAIDRGWPHQIIIPAEEVRTQNYDRARAFCPNLSLCPRGHSLVKDDKWHSVYCFAVKEHAAAFRAEFGGEWFDPSTRGRGRKWSKIKPPRPKTYG